MFNIILNVLLIITLFINLLLNIKRRNELNKNVKMNSLVKELELIRVDISDLLVSLGVIIVALFIIIT